jgi:hypothetical protein
VLCLIIIYKSCLTIVLNRSRSLKLHVDVLTLSWCYLLVNMLLWIHESGCIRSDGHLIVCNALINTLRRLLGKNLCFIEGLVLMHLASYYCPHQISIKSPTAFFINLSYNFLLLLLRDQFATCSNRSLKVRNLWSQLWAQIVAITKLLSKCCVVILYYSYLSWRSTILVLYHVAMSGDSFGRWNAAFYWLVSIGA